MGIAWYQRKVPTSQMCDSFQVMQYDSKVTTSPSHQHVSPSFCAHHSTWFK